MAKKSMILKQQAPAKYSTRKYNRCKVCGRPHAYLRDYGLCRICFREMAQGCCPGPPRLDRFRRLPCARQQLRKNKKDGERSPVIAKLAVIPRRLNRPNRSVTLN